MSLELNADEFEKIVIDELDELPDEMVDGLDNVVFVCEDRPEDGSLDLLGVYEGVALTERGQYGFGVLPDRIVLFREPLLAICETEDELRDEIHITLVHEIAHFYGIDDAELHRLGWPSRSPCARLSHVEGVTAACATPTMRLHDQHEETPCPAPPPPYRWCSS